MDYAVTGNVDYRLSYIWTWIMGSTASNTLRDSAGAAQYVDPAKILGYGGAGLAAVLSIAGAIQCATTIITNLEASFFAVLEDYQDNDDWNIINDDSEESKEFSNFITVYAWDTAMLMFASFWHVGYLMAMGLATTFLLFNKMSTLEADATYVYGTTDIPINIGFQLFIFGALLGSVDYIGGIALSYNSQTLLNMLSFYDKTKVKSTVYATTTVDAEGSGTFTKTLDTYTYRKKDLFSLFEMSGNWGGLFWSQRLLQMVQPYVYIAMIEVAVGIVFALTIVFGGIL